MLLYDFEFSIFEPSLSSWSSCFFLFAFRKIVRASAKQHCKLGLFLGQLLALYHLNEFTHFPCSWIVLYYKTVSGNGRSARDYTFGGP